MFEPWLDAALVQHGRLAPAVVSILQSVLRAKSVAYLSITGRTKDKLSALDKIKRKDYADPATQMTDLSGIRVVLYSESDVVIASNLISQSFNVDAENSLNQDELLGTNQTGYRSVHFVCDLGKGRDALPEFEGLANLKFEIQVRTVLQHAWAELSHDRNYKFAGKLPRDLERKLYLYAGLLEIADKGFDALSHDIDEYAAKVAKSPLKSELDEELNSITLRDLMSRLAEENKVEIADSPSSDNYSGLLREMDQFGIKTRRDLIGIIPAGYFAYLKENTDYNMNVYGAVRIWMLSHDWKRFDKEVKRGWVIANRGERFLKTHLPKSEYESLLAAFAPRTTNKIPTKRAAAKVPPKKKPPPSGN